MTTEAGGRAGAQAAGGHGPPAHSRGAGEENGPPTRSASAGPAARRKRRVERSKREKGSEKKKGKKTKEKTERSSRGAGISSSSTTSGSAMAAGAADDFPFLRGVAYHQIGVLALLAFERRPLAICEAAGTDDKPVGEGVCRLASAPYGAVGGAAADAERLAHVTNTAVQRDALLEQLTNEYSHIGLKVAISCLAFSFPDMMPIITPLIGFATRALSSWRCVGTPSGGGARPVLPGPSPVAASRRAGGARVPPTATGRDAADHSAHGTVVRRRALGSAAKLELELPP